MREGGTTSARMFGRTLRQTAALESVRERNLEVSSSSSQNFTDEVGLFPRLQIDSIGSGERPSQRPDPPSRSRPGLESVRESRLRDDPIPRYRDRQVMQRDLIDMLREVY